MPKNTFNFAFISLKCFKLYLINSNVNYLHKALARRTVKVSSRLWNQK